jgi:L-methionine (R)-S-oxide reductase
MSESLSIPKTGDRKAIYEAITPQIAAIIGDETDQTANLANVVAALREAFGFFWVGFYLVKGKELVLGPFQGPIACTRIAFNRGVCGHCYTSGKTVLVPDVEQFPGHIACNTASRSEVVVPVFGREGVAAVLDVDSDQLDDFSEVDVQGLEAIIRIVESACFRA